MVGPTGCPPNTQRSEFMGALLPGVPWGEWAPGMRGPWEVFEEIAAGAPVLVPNAEGFERLVWVRLAWPDGHWTDSLFLVGLAGLPSSLDDLGELLLGQQKDGKGQALTLSLSKLDHTTKALPALFEGDLGTGGHLLLRVVQVWHRHLYFVHETRDSKAIQREHPQFPGAELT